jgi:hypothetical protein
MMCIVFLILACTEQESSTDDALFPRLAAGNQGKPQPTPSAQQPATSAPEAAAKAKPRQDLNAMYGVGKK